MSLICSAVVIMMGSAGCKSDRVHVQQRLQDVPVLVNLMLEAALYVESEGLCAGIRCIQVC
jgi:hypothetical protein